MTDDTQNWDNLTFDADGRLIDLDGDFTIETYGPPPEQQWVPITAIPHPRGRRVCITTPQGPVYDHRSATDIYTSTGTTFINIVTEDQWYRWLELEPDKRPSQIPRAVPWPTRHVWALVPKTREGPSNPLGAAR